MTARILVIRTEDGITHMAEYIPGEGGITLDLEQETPRKSLDWGRGTDDLTATLSMVNPTITHYSSTAPMGSAEVAHHLGVLPDIEDHLAQVWGAAEPTSDFHPGDTLISLVHGQYSVYTVTHEGKLRGDTTRIHRRAPRREPWQDLEDVLLEDRMVFEEDAEGIAKRLHERGVRVTGGDES